MAPPTAYLRMFGCKSAAAIVREAVLELSFNAHDLAPFARDLGGAFDPADPAQSRDDIRYIYSTFPIVEREETAKWGSNRSRDLCLAWKIGRASCRERVCQYV